jgi:hypothetical protein
MSNPIPKRRRWFRISLRTLLVFIAILGIWLGFQVAAVRRQRNALQTLQASGGWTLRFDYQCKRLPNTFRLVIDQKAVPPGPEWLRNLAGEDFFRTTYTASWNDRAGVLMQDSVVTSLAALSDLRELIMRPTIRVSSQEVRRFNDDDAAKLTGLKKLVTLDLSGIDIHEPGLRSIAQLKNLKSLQLDFADYTNSRRDTKPMLLDDASMQHLGELTSLDDLKLERVRFVKGGIGHLTKLKELASLVLLDCEGLDDAGLERLVELPKLRSLYLYAADITDSGIVHLESLTHLKTLYVERSQGTRDGLVKLREALPQTVKFDPPAGTAP